MLLLASQQMQKQDSSVWLSGGISAPGNTCMAIPSLTLGTSSETLLLLVPLFEHTRSRLSCVRTIRTGVNLKILVVQWMTITDNLRPKLRRRRKMSIKALSSLGIDRLLGKETRQGRNHLRLWGNFSKRTCLLGDVLFGTRVAIHSVEPLTDGSIVCFQRSGCTICMGLWIEKGDRSTE